MGHGMAYYLVQHGKALTKEQDNEQALSEEGIYETKLIASKLKDKHIKITAINHSGKKRAYQTAEIFAQPLGLQNMVEQIKGIKPLDDVETFMLNMNQYDDHLIVSHLPFLENLMTRLVKSTKQADAPNTIRNSHVICIDKTDSDDYTIQWVLTS
jgi:phosphohistidine phosphatase